MRLSINLLGKKYDYIIINDDNTGEPDHEMNSNNNIDENSNNNMDNENNYSNNNININDNNTNMNQSDNSDNNNGNRNSIADRFGILSRFLPSLTSTSRNQQSVPGSQSPRTHSHGFRLRRSSNNSNNPNTRNNAANNTSNNPSTTNDNHSLPLTNSSLTHSKSDTNVMNTNAYHTHNSPSMLDINSNALFNHRDSLEDSSDLDNENDTDKRRTWRKPFTRSDSTPSMEDSGFSSSNCLSDNKDDTPSINSSFDCDVDDDTSKISKQIPAKSNRHPFTFTSVSARRRARTYSIDSTSSDLSDTNSNSNTPTYSSSVPSCNSKSKVLSLPSPKSSAHDDSNSDNNDSNEDNRKNSSPRPENGKLSATGAVKRRSLRNKSRRSASNSNSALSNHISGDSISSKAIDTDLPATVLPSESEPSVDTNDERTQVDAAESENHNHIEVISNNDDNHDLNNNNPDLPCKNLGTCVDAVIPFRFTDFFGCHGFVALIACIVYTLFLILMCGGLALSWTILKKCFSPTDLKGLRADLMESRRKREIVTTSTDEPIGDSYSS